MFESKPTPLEKFKKYFDVNLPENKWSRWFLLLGGIVLPLAATLFEITTHFCAHHFFDPFPSLSHVLLFLVIPLSNFLVLMAQRKNLSDYYAPIVLSTGMAAGVATMYSLMFLPIIGLSLLFSLVLGFGLLGLAPLIAVPCTLNNGNLICRLASSKTYIDTHQTKHMGHLLVLIMVVSIELPSTMTRIHLNMAADKAQAKEGIQWLRAYGNREVMLRACYERSGRATDIVGSLYEAAHPLSVDEARRIYYRVTGTPFNNVPLPESARGTINHTGATADIAGVNKNVQDEFDLDTDIAGEKVSGQARGLSLTKSLVQGNVDPDALLSDLTWTLDFSNNSNYDREARTKLLLPKGATVNGATYVVDGVEHKAEILLRKEARKVYVASVTNHAKNPLLISACGPDEVLVQCFPVPSQKSVEVRLSIVSPLALCDDGSAAVGLPTVIEKNFVQNIDSRLELKSSRSLSASTAGFEIRPESNGHSTVSCLDGTVNASLMNTGFSTIRAQRDAQCKTVYCKNNFDGGQTIVERDIRLETYTPPKNLLVIVDGSGSMSGSAGEIAQGLKRLPELQTLQLQVIGDETETVYSGATRGGDPKVAGALNALDHYQFVGGQDDSPALVVAMKKAASRSDTAVLWIHGDQPVNVMGKDILKKLLEGKHDHPILYDFKVQAGPDQILDGISSSPTLVRVTRVAGVGSDLQRLIHAWRASSDVGPEFVSIPFTASDTFGKRETFASLSQLYANNLILNEISSNDSQLATEHAALYQIVTPVSSAVVKPVAEESTQSVSTGAAPEADTWLLLVVTGGFIAFFVVIQRRRNGTVCA